jgi:MFS family permease
MPTFRSALRVAPFRRLLAAHGLATVGQLMLTLALGVEVLDRTGSGLWVSLTVALGFVPYVLVSGLAGVLADRRSRSAVLVGSFGVRAGCATLLAAGLPSHWPIPALVGVAAVAAVAATPSYPALAAATPQLVPDRQLPPANALVTAVENAAWIAGPGVLGLVLVGGAGPAAAAGIATALFVLAAVAAASVRLGRPPVGASSSGLLADVLVGIRAVARRRPVRLPMSLAVVDNFLYGYAVVLLLLVADTALDATPHAAGWLNAALSAGAFAAMAVTNRLAGSSRPALVLALLLGAFATAVALLGVADTMRPAAALAAVAGATTLVAEVVCVTLLQRAAPEDVVARVFGVYDQLNVGAIAAGSALAGPLAALLGLGPSAALVAGACLVLTALGTARLAGNVPVTVADARAA